MTTARRPLRRNIALTAMTLLALLRFRAEVSAAPITTSRGEPPGADVFVMAREAVLRDRPSRESRFVRTLPGGSRLTLLEAGEQYLKVEVAAGEPPRDGASKPAGGGATIGYLSRDVASVFAPGDAGTADLVAAGRVLAPSEGHRRLAAAFLLCASRRFAASGPGNPTVDVLLGRTAEALAESGGPFPPGLEVARTGSAGPWTYTGDAFRRAAAAPADTQDEDALRVKEAARAGVLRQQYPAVSTSLAALWQETAAWLELSESGKDPDTLRGSADRLGSASLSLGRLLVAAGRLEDVDRLESRVRGAGGRARTLLPQASAGNKLLGRAQILRMMRGNGSALAPQEARRQLGPKEVIVRIEGKPGGLTLVVETTVGGTHQVARPKSAIPVLPVPGSLRMSPDARSAAWIEIAGPSKLLPVVASLERDEPAREVAILADGRPLRDHALLHVVSTLAGYSKDGQRLGMSIQAWSETPGPDPRWSVVSVGTGEIVYETTKDSKSFRRLME
ncbi:MAG: hypothetical protein ABI592_00430 [Acidobacteriota bacterium]